VHTLQQQIAKVLAEPQARQRLLATGQEPVGNPPTDFTAQFKSDMARYAKVIEQAQSRSWSDQSPLTSRRFSTHTPDCRESSTMRVQSYSAWLSPWRALT
jgi:hypothetical protein